MIKILKKITFECKSKNGSQDLSLPSSSPGKVKRSRLHVLLEADLRLEPVFHSPSPKYIVSDHAEPFNVFVCVVTCYRMAKLFEMENFTLCSMIN